MVALLASTFCADAEQAPTILPIDSAIVTDAKQRWARAGGTIEELEATQIPIVTRAFGERCVHFFIKPDFAGGEPSYCYEEKSDAMGTAVPEPFNMRVLAECPPVRCEFWGQKRPICLGRSTTTVRCDTRLPA